MEAIHQDNKGWWFWIETWCDRCGPFKSEGEAMSDMHRYCEQALGISRTMEGHILFITKLIRGHKVDEAWEYIKREGLTND